MPDQYAKVEDLEKIVRALNARLRALEVRDPSAGIIATGWTALVFVNNWANFGSGFSGGEWCKDIFGFVYVRGLIKRTSGSHANGETIATLPVGARPAGSVLFNQRTNSGTVRIDVNTAGSIIIWDDPAPSPGLAESYTSLAGIHFRTT